MGHVLAYRNYLVFIHLMFYKVIDELGLVPLEFFRFHGCNLGKK